MKDLSIWKMMGRTLIYTAFLILLGVALLWELFQFLRQDAFIHHSSNEFDRLEISAHALQSRIFTHNFRIIFENQQHLADISLEIRTSNLIVDGVELTDRLDVVSRYFLTLKAQHPRQIPRSGGVALEFDLYCVQHDDISIHLYTLSSIVKCYTNNQSATIYTNNLEFASTGRSGVVLNMRLNHDYIVTITNSSGEVLLDSKPVTNIEFRATSTINASITSSEEDLFWIASSLAKMPNITIAAKSIEVFRTSGELTFFQTSDATKYTPIRQYLFFTEGTKYSRGVRSDGADRIYNLRRTMPFSRLLHHYDPLRIYIHFEEQNGAELTIHGMVADARISGFSIIPNFTSWLYGSISILATAILTAMLGGVFGGVFMKSKRNEELPCHCRLYRRGIRANVQRRRKL